MRSVVSIFRGDKFADWRPEGKYKSAHGSDRPPERRNLFGRVQRRADDFEQVIVFQWLQK